MKLKLTPAITTAALVLAAANTVYAQYTPPAPLQPFPGFINDALRKQDPYYSVWDVGGAVRLRYEVKENGLGLPPVNDFRQNGVDNDNSYFSDKILARVAYTDKWWSAYVEGRSSSTTGDDRTPKFETDDPIDLHQAYFTLGNHKEFPVSLKVGRQELSYGDERLVGAFPWHNIGRVFDAVKLRWQNEYFAADVFASRIVLPNDNNFNVNNEDALFSGVNISSKKIPKVLTEVYFFARNDSPGSTTADTGSFAPFQTPAPFERNVYTLGARFKSNPGDLGNFDFTVEGAYQFGDWRQTAVSAELDHEAFAGVVNVGYTFGDAPTAPRFALEYAYASGDSSPTDGKHGTFENLFPTNHKFYGYMDFLSWQNIHDVRAIFQMKPHPRLSLSLECHMFWLADTADSLYNVGGAARTTPGSTVGGGNGYNLNPSYDNYVGSEVDIVAGFILTKFATLEVGYGHFFRGDYIKQSWSDAAFGSQDADWVYVQTTVRF